MSPRSTFCRGSLIVFVPLPLFVLIVVFVFQNNLNYGFINFRPILQHTFSGLGILGKRRMDL
jgi:hypothetical protein